jgi:SAM-dependent methyltransferase
VSPIAVANPDRELAELREYLGDRYDHRQLVLYQQAVNDELAELGDEQRLYRESRAYLYNLTVFAMSPTKEPYLETLTQHVPPGSRVLDYGCGIGSDGLRLLEAGYEVTFADFDNPSVHYLRWRLARRGLSAQIVDLDRETPSGFDLVFAFDVIEHVDNPYDLLAQLETAGRLVLVNFLEDDPAQDEPHHRSLPIRRLVRHAKRRGLHNHRVYHGRSHLVLYAGA